MHMWVEMFSSFKCGGSADQHTQLEIVMSTEHLVHRLFEYDQIHEVYVAIFSASPEREETADTVGVISEHYYSTYWIHWDSDCLMVGEMDVIFGNVLLDYCVGIGESLGDVRSVHPIPLTDYPTQWEFDRGAGRTF